MTDDWFPTAELRFVEREAKCWPLKTLQQKWRRYPTPTPSLEEEWRDVPLVTDAEL